MALEAVGFWDTTARAEPEQVDAGPLYAATEQKQRADAAMDSGNFAFAIRQYRASYEVSRDPALLFNIGSAYQRLGDYPVALSYLQQFALTAPPSLRNRVPALPNLIASLRERLARVRVHCNVGGARIEVRGEWKGTTPMATEIEALPGRALIAVFASGYRPFARDVELMAGRSDDIDVQLIPEPAGGLEDRSAEHDATRRAGTSPVLTKWWFWTGVGAVVTGGIVLGLALSHERGAPSGDFTPGQVSIR
jgi:hypothetical protein